jgi:hypothetical protein
MTGLIEMLQVGAQFVEKLAGKAEAHRQSILSQNRCNSGAIFLADNRGCRAACDSAGFLSQLRYCGDAERFIHFRFCSRVDSMRNRHLRYHGRHDSRNE